MKFKKHLIGLAVALGAVGLGWLVYSGSATEVEICLAKTGGIQDYVELRGTVELDRKETVYSRNSGTVQRILVRAGDEVQARTELLQMDPVDLDISLARAYAAYDAAQVALNNLKKHLKPEELKQIDLQIIQAETAVNSAQKDYEYKLEKLERYRRLYQEGAVSRQDLRDMEMQAIAAEGTLRDAEQRLKIVKSNRDMVGNGASKTEIAAAEANLEAARLQIKEIRTSQGRNSVFAGFSGSVLAKLVEEGTVVQPGTPLFEIGDDSTAYIRVDVLSDDAAKIRIGQKAIVSGDILDDREIPGEIFYIGPKAETSLSSLGVEQQRVEVRIRYDIRKYVFKPGSGLDVKIVIREKTGAVYLPEKAVFEKNGTDCVFRVEDGKLVLQAVRTGIENDDYYEVLGGIKSGQRVVVDPANALKPGMRVKAAKPR